MTVDLQSELVRGFELHRQGDWSQAEQIYRSILAAEPGNPATTQLLGSLMVQDGRSQDAIPLLQDVLSKEPNNTTALGNMGTAYSRLKQFPQAIDCYMRALAIEPNSPDVARNLGSVLLKARRFADAIPALKHALKLVPNNLASEMNLAIALLKTEQFAEAIPYFEKVLQKQPDHRQALAGLGQVLLKDEVPTERCLECWKKLAEQEPNHAGILNNLATTYKGLKRFDEAEAVCRELLEKRPEYLPAICNLGLVLASVGRFEEARDCLRQAIAHNEQRTDRSEQATPADEVPIDEAKWSEIAGVAYCQLAATTNMLGNQQEAEEAVAKALAINPDDAESHMMRGFLRMQNGDYQQGWPDYEWRKKGKHAPRKIPGKEWDGSSDPNQTVLLHAEQGLGDSIHFIRYAKLVRERAGRVAFLSHKPLTKLMKLCPYLDEVIADGEPLPKYDVQVPLLSLPGVFQTSFETVPGEVPYLFPQEELVEKWKQRLSQLDGFRIAIAWQGNKEFANDQYRRVPLQQFGVLAKLPNVHLISVQKGDGSEQLADIDFPVHTWEDMDTEAGAFMDSAAVMKNVDLVISPCTATPHLAGALGVPVWLAKSFAAEWRWFADDREQNPWYPSMRMFRQPTLGDWQSVFAKMSLELGKLLA